MTARSERSVMGKPENVFHMLDGAGAASRYPAIRRFETWDEVKKFLMEENDARTAKR